MVRVAGCLIVVALAAACSREEPATPPEQRNPVVAQALDDPLMTDPDLSSRNEGAAAITVALSLLLGAPAGYALARYNFRGKDSFRLLVLLTRAFPLAILALPLTVSFIRLGLYDTVIGVGLVHTVLALPFAALVTQGIFLGVPRELEEAAWVFGCSRFARSRSSGPMRSPRWCMATIHVGGSNPSVPFIRPHQRQSPAK